MVADWVKVDSYAEFREQMNIHCATEAEKRIVKDERRKIMNRVSRKDFKPCQKIINHLTYVCLLESS